MLIMQTTAPAQETESLASGLSKSRVRQSERTGGEDAFSQIMSSRYSESTAAPAKPQASNEKPSDGMAAKALEEEDRIPQINDEDDGSDAQAATYFIAAFQPMQMQALEEAPPPQDADLAAAAGIQPAEGMQEILVQDSDEVVSILEGTMPNTDMTPQEDGAVAQQADASGGFSSHIIAETARMPQQTGSMEPAQAETAEETGAAAVEAEGAPCPLENESDAPVQNGEQYSEEKDNGSGNNSALSSGQPRQQVKAARADTAKDVSFPVQQTVDISPERVASEEQLASAEGTKASVPAERLFDTMVEKMELSQEDGASRLEIQLKPDYLGKVSILLSLGENGLHAKISAEDLSVRNMISGQINQLIETLADKGIKIAEIDVVYTGVSDYAFDPGSERGNADSSRESSRSPADAAAVRVSSSDMAEEDYASVIDTEISSVEYRA